MSILGGVHEIHWSQVFGAVMMIGGLVTFMILMEPQDVNVLHHLNVGITLGSVVLTCISFTILKVSVQIYEFPDQHKALCWSIFLVNVIISGVAYLHFVEQKHLMDPLYIKVGIISGASEILASGFMHQAL